MDQAFAEDLWSVCYDAAWTHAEEGLPFRHRWYMSDFAQAYVAGYLDYKESVR